MTNPYALFRQTAQQLRKAGALGGKAAARNRRARLAAGTSSRKAETPRFSHGETTAAAIAALDAQFPGYSAQRSASAPNRLANKSSTVRVGHHFGEDVVTITTRYGEQLAKDRAYTAAPAWRICLEQALCISDPVLLRSRRVDLLQ